MLTKQQNAFLYTLMQRLSNYGSLTTCGSRDLPLRSLKILKKLKFKLIAIHAIADNLAARVAIAFHFFSIMDILWNLLPYSSTDFPLYSQQQKRDLKHYEHGASRHIFPAHLAPRL